MMPSFITTSLQNKREHECKVIYEGNNCIVAR